MTKTVSMPDMGVEFDVPDTYDEPAIEAAKARFRQWYPQHLDSGTSGVPGSDSGEFDYHNYDPARDMGWGEWAGNEAYALGRGTGKLAAYAGDTLWNGLKMGVNDYLELTGQGSTGAPAGATNYSDPTYPVSQAYGENVPAVTKGFEGTETAGEIAGPAIIEGLLTEGRSFLRNPSWGGIPAGVVRTAARATRDVGLGYGGGELGGMAAANIGGEKYRDLGSLLGGAALSVGAPTLARIGVSKMLTTPESLGRLKTIDDYNAGAPPEAQIPPTMGLVGSKSAGTLEDITGRTIVSQGAAEARRQQFTGMEEGARQALADARGGPAAGQITKEGIGGDAEVALASTQGKIKQKVQGIQDPLEQRIGETSPTSLANTFSVLGNIIRNRLGVGAGTRNQAADLLDSLRANLGSKTVRQGGKRTRVSTPAGYGAIKDERTDLGQKLDREGRSLKKGLQRQTYAGMTEDMKATAQAQGVSPAEFDAAQAETTRLMKQGGINEKLTGSTQGETYNKTVGKVGTRHLSPMHEHSPDELVALLADDVELRLREGSAGLEADPELFNPKNFQHWRSLSPERKAILSRNRPDVVRRMDDLAKVGKWEEIRGGRRTRPGITGSTMGATLNYALPALAGAAAGHFGLVPAAITAGAAITPKLVADALTNPQTVRTLVKGGGPGLAQILARATGSTGGSLGGRDTPLDVQQRDERDRQFRRDMGLE
jgi:hypothetical protein